MIPEFDAVAGLALERTRFTSIIAVRPDDIDMNQQVHASRYQDYLLAARYEQMARDYGLDPREIRHWKRRAPRSGAAQRTTSTGVPRGAASKKCLAIHSGMRTQPWLAG